MNNKLKRLQENKIESKLIFDGRILHLYVDKVSLPDGGVGEREYCKHNGGVCVLPLTSEGEVILVEQYRYAHSKITLEVPAGKLEAKDTDIQSAALRELREETGAVCKKLTYLGQMFPSPALMDEVIHMYLAEELEFGNQELDTDEFLDCVKMPLEQLVAEVCAGNVPDAKTQICALRAWKILEDIKKI
ncbi:MAG: NUDIX hydrolase [Ruminococcaceae bacterium]|nr:NUDIX hydrolase [Oscillospiraceae bacterium]